MHVELSVPMVNQVQIRILLQGYQLFPFLPSLHQLGYSLMQEKVLESMVPKGELVERRLLDY